jgi:hypothetical protein
MPPYQSDHILRSPCHQGVAVNQRAHFANLSCFLSILCLLPNFASPQDLKLQSSQFDSSPPETVASSQLSWSAHQVCQQAIQADPLRNVLLQERKLAQLQKQSHKSNCAIQNWIIYHLDQRIIRREQELRAQALKLHFGLVAVQAQSLVLDDLNALLKQYTDMVQRIATAEEATIELEQNRIALSADIDKQTLQLTHTLAQLRVQLNSLLQCPKAQHYWPSESLFVHFRTIDQDQQLQVAKQNRGDVSVWHAVPRVQGSAEELGKIEKLLGSSWLLSPTSVPDNSMLKLLAHSRITADQRRQWSIRKQQLQEISRAKSLEMETDVRLKSLDLEHAYRQAEQTQASKQQAFTRMTQEQKLADNGIPSAERLWKASFEYQRLRSESFRALSTARQAEIELAFATANDQAWLAEYQESQPAIEAAETLEK